MEFLQSVGLLDIVFIAILSISILIGLIRGAIREVLSLVGLAAALYLAFKFSDMVSKNYVSQFFEQPKISYIISFILIIVAAIFTIALINLFISQLLKASGLSFINRLLGLVFGALRGAIICSIIVLVIGFIPGATEENWWKESTLAPFFRNIAKRSFDYMPKEVIDYVDSTKKNIEKTTGINRGEPSADQPSGSVRPSSSEQQAVDHILQSIDQSLKSTETQPMSPQPTIQLESSNGTVSPTDAETKPNNPPTPEKPKLILESYE